MKTASVGMILLAGMCLALLPVACEEGNDTTATTIPSPPPSTPAVTPTAAPETPTAAPTPTFCNFAA
jgi:hypothetical protein